MAESAGTGNDAVDPETITASAEYRRLLVVVGIIGLLVSLAAWGLLTLVPLIQDGAYEHLPNALGFDKPPWWWPVPIVTIAGLITALVIARMPGGGGGVPADRPGPCSHRRCPALSSQRSPHSASASCSGRPRPSSASARASRCSCCGASRAMRQTGSSQSSPSPGASLPSRWSSSHR